MCCVAVCPAGSTVCLWEHFVAAEGGPATIVGFLDFCLLPLIFFCPRSFAPSPWLGIPGLPSVLSVRIAVLYHCLHGLPVLPMCRGEGCTPTFILYPLEPRGRGWIIGIPGVRGGASLWSWRKPSSQPLFLLFQLPQCCSLAYPSSQPQLKVISPEAFPDPSDQQSLLLFDRDVTMWLCNWFNYISVSSAALGEGRDCPLGLW